MEEQKAKEEMERKAREERKRDQKKAMEEKLYREKKTALAKILIKRGVSVRQLLAFCDAHPEISTTTHTRVVVKEIIIPESSGVPLEIRRKGIWRQKTKRGEGEGDSDASGDSSGSKTKTPKAKAQPKARLTGTGRDARVTI